MSNDYRVRYKKGDLEIEVQSTDKAYVDSTLEKLMEAVPKSGDVSSKQKRNEGRKTKTKRTRKTANASGDLEPQSTVDAAQVVNAINDSEDHQQIEEHILNKRSQLPRVLLAFKFAHECGVDALTTGDVERITDQAGVKIHVTAVSHCISKNRKYFSAAVRRKKGAKVPYKLNRQGKQAFTKVLSGEKLK